MHACKSAYSWLEQHAFQRWAVLPQVPHEAGGSTFLLPLLGMLKDGEALRMFFGPDRDIELETDNAYRHAGMEYRLDNSALFEKASVSTRDPLRGWLQHAFHKVRALLIDRVTRLPHADEALRIVHYHELQAVLCELDAKAKPRTRGLQGPLHVSDNKAFDDYHGTASS